jgi:type II secretory pathway component GspD/PulD (secretin)
MAGVAVFGSVLWLQAQDPKSEAEKSAPVPAAKPASEPATQPEASPAPPQDPPPVVAPRREPIDPDAREIQFSFVTQPWEGVLQWIAEVAGLSLQMDVKPSGTFNYINDPRKYTLGGALDVLNAQLLPKGFTLIRKGNYLKVVPLEEGIPADLVPRITPVELDSRGESEFVSVIFPVKNVLAKAAAEEVKNLVGKYGKVVPLDSVNRLMITDTAGNVRLMRDLLDQIDGEGSALQSKTRIFQLKYTVASKVEVMLRDVLGIQPRSTTGSQSGSRSSGDPRDEWRNRMREMMERGGGPFGMMFGGGDSGGGSRGPGGGDEERRDRGGDSRRSDQQQQQQQSVYLAVDDRLNQILVKAPADTLALVDEIISKVDVPREGEDPFKPREPQTPTVRVYRLSDGDAQSLVTALQAIFQNTPGVRFSADQANNAVVAVATPDDQKAIAELVRDFENDERDSIVLALSVLEAAAVTDLLTNVYASTQRDWRGNPVPRPGQPRVVADIGRNQIMVRGSKKQIEDIRGMLASLGETQLTAASSSDRIRVVPLTSTDQRALSEALMKIWPTVRPNNPIRIIEPGKRPAANGDPTAAPKDAPAPDETYKPNTPSAPSRPSGRQPERPAPPATESGRTARDVDSPVRLASFVATTDDPQEPIPPAAPAKPADSTQPPGDDDGAPVVVAFGPDNIVVASDDPAALNAFMNLLKSLTRGGGAAGGSDYTVYYLKAADATAITTTLNDLLGISTVSSSFSFFGSQRQQPTTSLKIVPDVRTNSLIIVGSSAEVTRVTQLLEVLDRPDAPQSGAVSQPRIIPVRFGIATQISQVIRDVYANQLTAGGQGSSRFTVGFGGFGQGGSGGSNNPAGARGTLSIGVDESSNSLVVSCSERMFEEVRQLVELLDTAANDTQRTVKIVTVRNAAPTAVQDALNGLMGIQSTSQRGSDSRNSSSRSSSGFPGGGPPMPFGGFPGGFPGGFDRGGSDRDRGGDRGGDRGSDGDRFRREMFERMFRGGDRGRD